MSCNSCNDTPCDSGCGCPQQIKGKITYKDLTGLKFNSFYVNKRQGTAKSGASLWECNCEDCNNISIIYGTKLTNYKATCQFCKKKQQSNITKEYVPKTSHKDFIDYTNQKINSFLVIGRINKRGIKDRHIKWLCKCEDCGNEVIKSSNRLKKRTPICYICKENNKIKKVKSFTNRKNPNDVAFNLTYCHYKKAANLRGYSFELTKEEFANLTILNCLYCGASPSNIKKSTTGGIYRYSGIDRLNNNIGYTIQNCAPCCKECNYMKHISSFEEFKERIEKIYLRIVDIEQYV